MKFKGAWTILKKEMEFLGMTFDQLCVFIERNPYAQNRKTIIFQILFGFQLGLVIILFLLQKNYQLLLPFYFL